MFFGDVPFPRLTLMRHHGQIPASWCYEEKDNYLRRMSHHYFLIYRWTQTTLLLANKYVYFQIDDMPSKARRALPAGRRVGSSWNLQMKTEYRWVARCGGRITSMLLIVDRVLWWLKIQNRLSGSAAAGPTFFEPAKSWWRS